MEREVRDNKIHNPLSAHHRGRVRHVSDVFSDVSQRSYSSIMTSMLSIMLLPFGGAAVVAAGKQAQTRAESIVSTDWRSGRTQGGGGGRRSE